ncbi:ABC transporter substrate-binding protein [Paraburkholderia pallida]|uniref:ABC transporter substrate-binding protein n=1 Tax=Paraburkholderia pallida TaxID=2547399 RepID=A0A4V1AZD4_9BURK|nr:ABC transporter substrate-binding protein [Paraburkholderia pallida]QBQ98882.1 ABC transporter substrate-binding protein [Paraburkholderia pallida]
MSEVAESTVQSIWFTRCPVPTPLGIAAHLGWFDEEFARDRITVRSLQETRDTALTASHIDHTLANSFRQGGSIPALWARAAGAQTRVIGLTWVDEAQAIVTLPDSGIRTARDLRGRRLGLPARAGQRIDIFRAAALRGFTSVLELEGIGAREVEWIDVAASGLRDVREAAGEVVHEAAREEVREEAHPTAHSDAHEAHFSNPSSVASRRLYAAEATALLRGEVDAIYVKGSLGLETAWLIGARVVIDIGFHPEPRVRVNNGSPRPLTVNAATLEAAPEVVGRFLARVIDVDNWARAHPDKVLAYLGRETGSSDEWLRRAYGADVHLRLRTGLDEASIAALDGFKQFLLAQHVLPADFDLHEWIDPRALERVERSRTRGASSS